MAKTKNKSPTDKKLPKKNSLKELINGLKKSPDNPKFSKKAADKYEKIQKLKKKYEKGGKENLKNFEKMKKEEKELNQIMKKYNIKQNNKKDKKGKDGKTKDKKKDKQSKKKKGKDGDKDKSDKKRDKKKGKGDKIKKSEKDETKGKNKDDKEKRKAERRHKRKESKEKRREARNRRREIRRKRREEREKRRTAKEEALLEYERNKKGFVPPDINDIEREAKRRNENQYANVDIEKQSLDEQRSKTIATVCIIFMCILASLLTADQMLDFFTCNEKPQSISDNSVGGQISGPSYDQNVNNPDCCCGNNNYNGGNNNYGGNNNNGGTNGGNTNYVTGVGGNNNNGGTNNYGGTGGDTGTDQNYGYGGDSGTGNAGDSGTGTTGDSGTGTGGDAPGSDVDYGDLFTTTLASVITTTKQTVFTTPPFDPDMPFTLDVSILITEYQGGPVENDWMEEDTQKKLEWHSRLVVPLREMWGLMGVEKFITNFRMEKIYPSPGFYDSIATSTHITFDMQDELIGRLKWYGMPITQDYEYATQMSGLYEFLLMEVNLKGFPLYIGTSDTDWEGIVLDDVPTIRAPDLIPDTWQREPYKYK